MRAEYVNPFIESASVVLSEIAALSSTRGKLALKDTSEPFRDVCAILGIVGDIHGQVVYGFDHATARAVVSKMMMGAEVKELDDMARSALGELANIITGKSAAELEKLGFVIDISPPTLVIAEKVQLSSVNIPMIIVPLDTDVGVIDIYAGLEQKIT